MYKLKIILFVLLALLLKDVSAQKYNIKTYSANNGLPSSQVYDVHFDDYGFIWFATANGLVNFDGITFKTYDRSNGLKSELALDIFEDSKKNMWVSSEGGGVALFKEDSLIYLPELALLDTMLVNYILETPSGELWFSTNSQGIIIWNSETNSISEITTNDGLPSNQVWDLTIGKNGEVYIATMSGVAEYKSGEGITQTWTKKNGMSGEATYQVYEAIDGTKWIATSNGVTLIKNDGTLETITEVNGEPFNYVYNITQDDEGLIWIGTERRGLYWFDGQNYTHITKNNGLSSNYIHRLVKAKDGTIWIATDGNGVNIFKDKRFRFYDTNTGLGSNSVYGMLRARNNVLWFGNEKGLTKYSNGTFKTFVPPKNLFYEDEIWGIKEFSNGNLLLLTYNYSIIVFDGSKFYELDSEVNLSTYYINDFYIDDDDAIYFGDSNGLLKYEDGKLEPIKINGNYWGRVVISIFKDSRNKFWLGTYEGLVKYDGDVFTRVGEEQGILGKNIYGIIEDEKGRVWVGTDKGIFYSQQLASNADTLVFQIFGEEDYQTDETVFLQFDDSGGLWQGTNTGLNYYDLSLWNKRDMPPRIHYALQEYGKGAEFNEGATILDETGRLWFGTAHNGLVIHDYNFQKEKKIRADTAPKTFIREVFASGTQVFKQSEVVNNTSTKVVLKYNSNSIEFKFGALNYADPLRLFYKYRLLGFEDSWNVDFNLRAATYTNLKPGSYTFEVLAKSMRSEWSEVPSKFEVVIEKPFWLTLWFLVIVLLSLGLLVVLYIHVRIGQLEKKKLKQLVDEQTNELTEALSEKEVLIKEIHHRVKNNLAVISGLLQLQTFQSKNEDVTKALVDSQNRIQSIALVHEMLYQSETLAYIDYGAYINSLLKKIKEMYQSGEKNIELISEIDPFSLNINQAISSSLLINEVLVNAFKHAFTNQNEGVVSVKGGVSGDIVTLIIADNGKGINEEEFYSAPSLGATLIKTLANQLRGEIKISEPTKGTGAIFTIAFKKEMNS